MSEMKVQPSFPAFPSQLVGETKEMRFARHNWKRIVLIFKNSISILKMKEMKVDRRFRSRSIARERAFCF